MKEFKGTKGEWRAEKPKGSNGYWFVNNESNNSGAIATCYNVSGLETDLETEANAKLIASAPDLLKALLYFLDHGENRNSIKKAKKAIEKALN